ncbi:MAG: HAD family hydrolase [Treponema sp.]|jgi:putative hydrolase of the HAD superfamily|nr:HAD family hydrolase [Treponema sp.]
MTKELRSRLIRLIQEHADAPWEEALPDLPADFEALLLPAATHAQEEERRIRGVKTVIFDIYGTLFSSSAGDIAVHTGYAGGSFEGLLAPDLPGGLTGEELKDFFRRSVMNSHIEKYVHTPYPEVRVEEIWATFLTEHLKRETNDDSGEGCGHHHGKEETDPAVAAELALRYELAVNPVYPMEGVRETLKLLSARGFHLGLISNAQFYTPLLFEAFFGASVEELGFDPELVSYSYELGEAKPSPSLFAPALRRLAALGQGPETCLYVGNDMLNDIFAAAASGFKTLLFAGDRRSLRLREGNKLCGNTRPSGVIRRLAVIPEILA